MRGCAGIMEKISGQTDSEYEADTDLTVREFLKRSVLETDAELLAV